MKNIYLLIFILLPSFLLAQNLPTNPETDKIMFTEVVEVPWASQKELHDKSKVWIAENFKSAEAVTKLDSEDQYIISGISSYGYKAMGSNVDFKLYFTLTVYFKDGKYKYETTDFLDDDKIPMEKHIAKLTKTDGSIREYFKKDYDASVAGMKQIGKSYKAGMAKLISKSKSDW